MKKCLPLFLFTALLFSLFFQTATAQRANWIIKTDLVSGLAENPSLKLEKILAGRWSAEAGGVWTRRERASNGGEGADKKFYPANGFRIYGSARYYSSSQSKPFGFYLSAMMQYNSITIKNLEQVHSTSGFYERTIDLHQSGPEIVFLAGNQFALTKRISAEISTGPGHYWERHREKLIAGQAGPDFVNGVYTTNFSKIRFHLHLNIGFIIE